MSSLAERARTYWEIAGVREMARGGATGVVASIGNRVLTILTAILLARMLGTDGYGIYATAIAAMMILAVLAEFGMYTLLVREVSAAHARGAWGELMGYGLSAVRFTGLMAGALGVLGCAVIWFTPLLADPVEKAALTIMLALLPLSTLYRFGNAVLYGLRHIALAQALEQFLFPAIAFVLVLALFFAAGQGLAPTHALLAQVAAGALALATVGYLVWRALQPAREEGARVILTKGFQLRALPFLMMGAAGTITQQIDTVIVSALMGNSQTALYRVAAQAATLTWFGVQILQAVASPHFARLHQQGDRANLRRLFYWTNWLAIASAAPVLLAFVFFGRSLLALTFGAEFTAAQPIMVVLSAGFMVNVACGPVGSLLAMVGEERYASRAFVVVSIVAVSLAISLASTFGAIGVAFGMACGTAGYHMVLRVHTYRRLGF